MKRILILGSLLLLMVSCSKTPIDNYEGGIIHNKGESFRHIMRIRVPMPEHAVSTHEWRFVTPYVSKYDYDRYELGDTIQ